MTLKQGQDHQTWYELVNTKQGYNDAKLKKTNLNSIHENTNYQVFVKSGNMSIISLVYVQKWKIVVYFWPAWYA